MATTTGTIKATGLPFVKEVNLKSKQVDAGAQNGTLRELSFVQVSDLHVGPTIRDSLVEKVSEEIKKLRPDILFLTGDMVDAYPDANMMRILGS